MGFVYLFTTYVLVRVGKVPCKVSYGRGRSRSLGICPAKTKTWGRDHHARDSDKAVSVCELEPTSAQLPTIFYLVYLLYLLYTTRLTYFTLHPDSQRNARARVFDDHLNSRFLPKLLFL